MSKGDVAENASTLTPSKTEKVMEMEIDYNRIAMQSIPSGCKILEIPASFKQVERIESEKEYSYEPDFNRLEFLEEHEFPFLVIASRLFSFGILSFGLVIAEKDQPKINLRLRECGYKRLGLFQKPGFFKNKVKHSDLTDEEERFFKRELFREKYRILHRSKEGNIYKPVDQASFRQYLSANKILDY